MPEQRHLLDQRLVGREHLLDPPGAQLAGLLLNGSPLLLLLLLAIDLARLIGHLLAAA